MVALLSCLFLSLQTLCRSRSTSTFCRDANDIAELYEAAGEHPRADAAPAGVDLFRDARDIPVQERAADVFALGGEFGDAEADLADAQLDARDDGAPREAGDREVFAGGADTDWVPFGLQRADEVEREDHDGAIGPSVKPPIALAIAVE